MKEVLGQELKVREPEPVTLLLWISRLMLDQGLKGALIKRGRTKMNK